MNVPKQLYANQTPPYWYELKYQDKKDGDNVAVLVCPKNHHSRINRSSGDGGHKIDAQGVITPSCICGEPGCGFHEFLTLLSWNPPT